MESKHTLEPWLDEMFIPIKAGDSRLILGFSKQPPLVDVRILSEDNYQRAKECVNALASIEDPKKWVEDLKAEIAEWNVYSKAVNEQIEGKNSYIEELQAENTMLKNVLKGIDDSLTCISWEGDKPIRLVLEEEIEQLKAELKAANEFIEKGSK